MALRYDCLADARSGGALAEGASVSITRTGTGQCGGWSIVNAGSIETWVRDEFLASTVEVTP